MKALSGYPQWFWLLAKGWKDIENRNWATKYRGRVLLHASRHIDTDCDEYIHERLSDRQWDEYSQMDWRKIAGCIIGEVDIVDCVWVQNKGLPATRSPWFTGIFGFVTANPVLYPESIPYRGQPSIFNIPCSVEVPCCDRRDEYNGFASGPLLFPCPHHCGCHD